MEERVVRSYCDALSELVEGWEEPLINTSPWGDTVLEWWCGTRKLTVYIAPGFDGGCRLDRGKVESYRTDTKGPQFVTYTDIEGTDDFVKVWKWLKDGVCQQPTSI